MAERAWNVLHPAKDFQVRCHRIDAGGRLAQVADWQGENATIPPRVSFTIVIESDDMTAHGDSFVVIGSGHNNTVTIQDVIETVHEQCARLTGGGATGWWWGGLGPGPEEEVAILQLLSIHPGDETFTVGDIQGGAAA